MKTRDKNATTDKQMFDEKNRGNVIRILEQVWLLEPEDTFYKIFHKYSKRVILSLLHTLTDNLLNLAWKEEKGDMSHLECYQVDGIKNLMEHVEYLKQKADSFFEEDDFRHNKITQNDCVKYRSLNDSSMLNVSAKPPLCLAESSGSSGSSSYQLTPVESFKRSIKRDYFPTLKKESVGALGEGTL